MLLIIQESLKRKKVDSKTVPGKGEWSTPCEGEGAHVGGQFLSHDCFQWGPHRTPSPCVHGVTIKCGGKAWGFGEGSLTLLF